MALIYYVILLYPMSKPVVKNITVQFTAGVRQRYASIMSCPFGSPILCRRCIVVQSSWYEPVEKRLMFRDKMSLT